MRSRKQSHDLFSSSCGDLTNSSSTALDLEALAPEPSHGHALRSSR